MPYISKISKINNYKTWLNHEREVEFKKTNLIFGENGSGKSSLSEILQGVFDKKIVVNESKTITIFEPNQNTEVEILLKNKEVLRYTNTIWRNQQKPDDLIIFDSNYIVNNIHINGENTGHLPKIKQNQNKLLVSFSEDAGKLKEKEKTARQNLTQFETENKLILQSGLVIDSGKNEDKMFNFYQNHDQKSINNLIQERESLKINKIQENSVNQNLLSKPTAINNLNITKFETGDVLLSSQETFLLYFATELIKQSQEQAKIDFTKDESFFRKAHEKIDHSTKKCPVCLNIISDDIIKLYEENFNEIYKNRKIEFENTAKKLKEELERINLECDNFNQKINNYEKNLFEINTKTNNLFKEINDIEAFFIKPKENNKNDESKEKDKPISKLISLIDEKQTKTVDFEITTYNQIKSIVDEFNEKQKSLKLFIDNKIQQLAKYKLDNTNDNLKYNFQENEEIIKLCNNEIDFLKSDKIESKKQKLSIEEEQKKLHEKYEVARKNYAEYLTGDLHTKQISRMQNILREDFNVSFVLVPKPSNKTNLKTNDVDFDYEIQKNNRTLRFKNLSEGERQIIALAFFFAQIEETGLKQDKILIFDDPVTSMDARNLKLLVDLVHKKTGEFSQVFIFTHHQLFYKYLTKTLSGDSYLVIKNRYEEKECSYLLTDNTKSKNRIKKLNRFYEELNNSIQEHNIDYEEFIIKYGGILRYSVEILMTDILFNKDDFT